MLHRAIATLRDTLRPHLGLSKDRVETLALIVVAMVSARTVNLSHLAAERPGATLVASAYRRLQRFFQYVQPGRDLGRDWAAPIAAKLAGLTGSWYLALDRTQWKMGAREINFLVLAAVTRRYRVPLLWTLLPGRGNSSTQQRIALMRRYIKLFGVSSIRLLLADREFIGHAWADFLCENNIPFAIRLRSAHCTTLLLRARDSADLDDSILQMEPSRVPLSSRHSHAHAIVTPGARQVAVADAVLVDHRPGEYPDGEPEPSGQSVFRRRPGQLQLSPPATFLPVCQAGGGLVGAGRGQAPEDRAALGLVLDRTNWKIGRRDVNILMLAVVTRRLRIPLMWTVIDKAGSSNQCERIALMRRYLALFGPRSIAWLLADREFKACPRAGGGRPMDRISVGEQHHVRHPGEGEQPCSP